MTNIYLFFILLMSIIVSTNITSLCMHNKDVIGAIDILMLARSVYQQGHTNIRRDIRNHQFTIARYPDTTSFRPILVPNPYRITHHCLRNENSALSDQVFNRIDTINRKEIKLEIINKFNQYPNAIDEHTTWEPIKNLTAVTTTAAFYDKKSLMTALNTVRKYENK